MGTLTSAAMTGTDQVVESTFASSRFQSCRMLALEGQFTVSGRALALRTLGGASTSVSDKPRLAMCGICFLAFFTLIPSTQRSDPLNGGSSTAGCEKREPCQDSSDSEIRACGRRVT